MVDNGYSSIITAISLARDKDVLTVELGERKHTEAIVIKCEKEKKKKEKRGGCMRS